MVEKLYNVLIKVLFRYLRNIIHLLLGIECIEDTLRPDERAVEKNNAEEHTFLQNTLSHE
jgi:hypothetical protein